MSSIENPGCCTLRPFGGGLLVFDKLLIYPTSLAGPVSIGASSPAVEPTLGGVPAPFAYDLLCLSLSLSWEFYSSTGTLVEHFGLSGGVGRYSYCED